ncbi:MAG: hypothetical protein ACI9KE_002684 [Polyangiales bacterium]|jgi:hypothetical protein
MSPLRLAGLFALVACTTSSPSLVIIHVDAESGVRTASDSYTLRIEGRDAGGEFREEFLETYQGWGRDFTLGPQDHDASRSYRVTLVAYQGANGSGDIVARNILVSGYVQSQTRRYELVLYDDCQDSMCTEEQRCDSMGECQSAEIPPTELPPFDAGTGGDGGPLPDGITPDTSMDGGVDAGRDGGPDAGPDGGPDAGPLMDAGPQPCESPTMVSVTVGQQNTCALTVAGEVYCWGNNDFAQTNPVGAAGTLEPNIVVLPLPDNFVVVEVQAGDEHVCALAKGDEGAALAGNVYCWGNNLSGDQNRLGAQGVSGPHLAIDGGAVALSVGGFHSCAAMNDESTQCWGQNRRGELGRGSDNRDQVVGPTVDPRLADTHVLAGFGNSCGYQRGVAGAVLECWGFDLNGAVGEPVGGQDEWTHRLVSLPGEDSDFNTVRALSASHTTTLTNCNQPRNEFGGSACGVFEDDGGNTRLYCWGSNGCAQVSGNGDRNSVTRPLQVSNDTFPPTSRDWILGVGGGTTCAARRTADEGPRPLFCWGDGSSGKLLNPLDVISSIPVPIMEDVDDVSVGMDHICAVSSGRVHCWGNGASGKTVPGTFSVVREPICVSIPAP